MHACWTSSSSWRMKKLLPNILPPPLPVNPLFLTRCQKLSTLFPVLLLSRPVESIFINMEKVSKNSTSRKPKKLLFESAGLKPVTPPTREEAVTPFDTDKVTKPEPKIVPIFDPDEYIRRTYGELNATNHILKAILREMAIVAHK